MSAVLKFLLRLLFCQILISFLLSLLTVVRLFLQIAVSISQHMKRTLFNSFILMNLFFTHVYRMFINCNVDWDHEHSISEIDISAHCDCSCYVHLRCFLRSCDIHTLICLEILRNKMMVCSQEWVDDCSWSESSSDC